MVTKTWEFVHNDRNGYGIERLKVDWRHGARWLPCVHVAPGAPNAQPWPDSVRRSAAEKCVRRSLATTTRRMVTDPRQGTELTNPFLGGILDVCPSDQPRSRLSAPAHGQP